MILLNVYFYLFWGFLGCCEKGSKVLGIGYFWGLGVFFIDGFIYES